jgi:hypothetical protein
LPDYVDTARRAVEEQLANLRDEIKRLEAAAAALGGTARRRGPGRPRKSGTATATTRRRGRRRASGTRAAQAQKLVADNPGITIRELAAKMGIKQNYLYRVLPQLEAEKKVRKKDKGWHPV